METLSQEIVRLSKLDSAVKAVNKNSTDNTNSVTSTLPTKKNALKETSMPVITKEAEVSWYSVVWHILFVILKWIH